MFLFCRFKLEEQARLLDRVKDLDFREMRVKGVFCCQFPKFVAIGFLS